MANLARELTSEVPQNLSPSNDLDLSILDQLKEAVSTRLIRDDISAATLHSRGATHWDEVEKAETNETTILEGRTFIDLVQDGYAEEALEMLDKFREDPKDREFLVFRDAAKLVLGHLNEIPDLLDDVRRLDLLVRAGFGKNVLPLVPEMGPKHADVCWELVLTGLGGEVFQYLDQFSAGNDGFGPYIASAYIATGYADLVLENLYFFGPLDDCAALHLLIDGEVDFVKAHIDDPSVFAFEDEYDRNFIESEIDNPSLVLRLRENLNFCLT